MPQAPDEQRDLMNKWFGDPINDGPPYQLLISHGFTEKAGCFFPPVSSHKISDIEHECLQFLVDEWDYGYEG